MQLWRIIIVEVFVWSKRRKRYLRRTSFWKQKFLAGKRLSQASGFDEIDLA